MVRRFSGQWTHLQALRPNDFPSFLNLMQPLTGFRDFLPAACAERNYIFAKWREVAGRYGFVECDGPVLEELDLYKKKSATKSSGNCSNFIDKGERDVALRPEMTPTLARIVAAEHRQFRKPLKWFSIPQVFRYERPQRGRLREHFQLNCDIVGEESAGSRRGIDRAGHRCRARLWFHLAGFCRAHQRPRVLDRISQARESAA